MTQSVTNNPSANDEEENKALMFRSYVSEWFHICYEPI